jgi:hypothetical protein
LTKDPNPQFGWLWEFFAEPPDEDTLGRFWKDVTESITQEFCERSTGKRAHAYFISNFRNDIKSAMRSFKRCLSLNEADRNSLDLLFMFGEARVLCEVEAMDGAPVIDETLTTDAIDPINSFSRDAAPDKREDPNASFSNFRALRRAFRFASADSDPTGIWIICPMSGLCKIFRLSMEKLCWDLKDGNQIANCGRLRRGLQCQDTSALICMYLVPILFHAVAAYVFSFTESGTLVKKRSISPNAAPPSQDNEPVYTRAEGSHSQGGSDQIHRVDADALLRLWLCV